MQAMFWTLGSAFSKGVSIFGGTEYDILACSHSHCMISICDWVWNNRHVVCSIPRHTKTHEYSWSQYCGNLDKSEWPVCWL